MQRRRSRVSSVYVPLMVTLLIIFLLEHGLEGPQPPTRPLFRTKETPLRPPDSIQQADILAIAIPETSSGNRSLVVDNAYEYTIQTLFLSPTNRGQVIGIATLMFLSCPERVPYLNDEASFELRLGTTNVTHRHSHVESWSLTRNVYAAVIFDVGEQVWMDWITTTPQVLVVDNLAQTQHLVTIMRDPFLTPNHHDNRRVRPYLAGMTWIYKNRRYYKSRRNWIQESDTNASTVLDSRDSPDSFYYNFIHQWIQHHRAQGVERIYLIDQENDLSLANRLEFEAMEDVVYIRAPYSFSDHYVDTCSGNVTELRVPRFIMQCILEGTVFRMAHADWVLSADPDEFIVQQGFANLPALVKHYENFQCSGEIITNGRSNLPSWDVWGTVKCQPLGDGTTIQQIFELQFYQVLVNGRNEMGLSNDKDDFWALTKCIYNTRLVAGSKTHRGYVTEPKHYASTKVSPRQASMVHFKGEGPFNLTSLLPLATDMLHHLQHWPTETSSSLMLVAGGRENAFKTLLLPPSQPGIIVGVISVAALSCDQRARYLNDMTFELRWHGQTFPSDNGVERTVLKEILTTVTFDVGMELWKEWAQNPPPKVLVVDHAAKTQTWLNVIVDPRFSRREKPEFLSALTWINKKRKGQPKKGRGSGSDTHDDSETLHRINLWIDHHRRQWVTHFYIIDHENDLRIPNVRALEGRHDVTYIRAPYGGPLDVSVDICPTSSKQYLATVMQSVFDTTVLRMAHTDWLLVLDYDEFIVPTRSSYLGDVVRDYTQKRCDGPLIYSKRTTNTLPSWDVWNNISCTKTNDSVFEMQFLQGFVDGNNEFTRSSDDLDLWAKTKCIYRTSFIEGSLVHFARPRTITNLSTTVSTKVSPYKGGYMVRFKGRGNDTQPINLDALVPKLQTSRHHHKMRAMQW